MEIVALLWQYLKTRRLASQFTSRAQLENWQEQQVQKLLRFVLPRSPFYRERFGTLRPDDWRELAPIDKKLMMDHFSDLNTLGIEKEQAFRVAFQAEDSRDFTPQIGKVTVGLSSGTSGNRGIFLVGSKERARWAGVILAKALPGRLWNEHRIAFFLRANSNLYTSVNRRRTRFSFFDLLLPAAEHFTRLNEFSPTVLVAPPSMLRFLAEAKRLGKLEVSPGKIISVAEVLDPLDEVYIREAFRQPVHQIYQCTEGFLAVTCPYGTIHVNEDIIVMEKEYLDEDRERFYPIITDFSRTTQPIIRYRLNDILTEKRTPCLCGSVYTALERIEGRADDVFWFKHVNGDSWVSVFPDFIRRAVMSASGEIKEYKVRQIHSALLEVSVQADERQRLLQEQVRDQLQDIVMRLGGKLPEITFTPYEREAGGKKMRRVERVFTPSETE
ncbi:F390 synthetase-related protein [Brevibacillus choshinensis]|uniref:F390 synthetase-related protein n=1 Tax=Brevibacillus choshinensis TaxID=54911 RepID=UPI002E1CBE67|nr:adenylate cyclase [Brevibacillus choshinensis]